MCDTIGVKMKVANLSKTIVLDKLATFIFIA